MSYYRHVIFFILITLLQLLKKYKLMTLMEPGPPPPPVYHHLHFGFYGRNYHVFWESIGTTPTEVEIVCLGLPLRQILQNRYDTQTSLPQKLGRTNVSFIISIHLHIIYHNLLLGLVGYIWRYLEFNTY